MLTTTPSESRIRARSRRAYSPPQQRRWSPLGLTPLRTGSEAREGPRAGSARCSPRSSSLRKGAYTLSHSNLPVRDHPFQRLRLLQWSWVPTKARDLIRSPPLSCLGLISWRRNGEDIFVGFLTCRPPGSESDHDLLLSQLPFLPPLALTGTRRVQLLTLC